MILAKRRFTKDVGSCQGCDRKNDEVTCIRIGSSNYSVEQRLCDECLATMLAEAAIASKAKAERTVNGSFVGCELPSTRQVTPIPKATGAIAQAATGTTSAWAKHQPKRKRNKAVPRPYRARKPTNTSI